MALNAGCGRCTGPQVVAKADFIFDGGCTLPDKTSGSSSPGAGRVKVIGFGVDGVSSAMCMV